MTEDNLISNDPYAAGILIVGDAKSIRRVDGTGNNLTEINRTVGAVGSRLRRLTPIEYEDGLASPAGVAFDTAGNQLLDQNGLPITRQPIPIFSAAEAQRLLGQGLDVRVNTENLSNNPDAPFVLVNPPDRPSAREVSNSISNLERGEGLPDPRGLSAMIWSFGQFVNHETDLAQTGGDLAFAEDIQTDQRELNFPIPIRPLAKVFS